MATRNQRILALSRLSAGLLLLVFVLLNASAARTNVRVDLTEEGIYTLSDASRHVLASLQDPATIKVFWHNVPQGWETDRRYTAALLQEMRAASRGRLTVRWVDLTGEEGKKEAEDAGVQLTQFQESVEGKIELAKGYNSLEIEMGDDQEVVDQLASEGERLEYEIVSRLHKMNQVDETVVGLVASRPPMNPFAGMQAGRFNALEYLLRKQYGAGFRSHLTLDEPVPSDVDVLLVVAPKDLEEEQAYRLEQYLLGGGRVLLFLDPVHADVGEAPPSQPDASGLEEWLTHLGVEVESGVVGDFQAYLNRPRLFRTARGNAWGFAPYPYWLMLLSEYMDKENPALRGFDQIPLFWPAALSIDEQKQLAHGRTATVEATTTEAGYRRKDLIGLDTVEADHVRETDLEPNIPLMVLLEGPMTSFWAGRPAPGEKKPEDQASGEPGAPAAPGGTASEATGTPDETAAPGGGEGTEPASSPPAEGTEGADAAPAPGGEESAPPDHDGDGEEDAGDDAGGEDATEEGEAAGPARLESGSGRLLVLTDAELVSDDAARLGRNYAYGFEFVQNLVDWMGGSDDLLSLRARARKARVIDDVEAKDQRLIKWANVSVIPLLALLGWVVVFIVRRVQS